jgi:UDPglucose--hexose-1-phosphate uridylyltransferase
MPGKAGGETIPGTHHNLGGTPMKDREIRQNLTTNQWVIFAPARGKRPHDFVRKAQSRGEALALYVADCPFCPGNEEHLTPIIEEVPGIDGKHWRTRVVPNKFPAMTTGGDAHRFQEGIYLSMKGVGRHEVIIESPKHNEQIATMDAKSVLPIVETYHRRYTAIFKDTRSTMVVIFRNYGPKAGTSLIHPHSQLIAVNWVPSYIRWREDAAEQYYDKWGRCVHCDMINFEMRDARRTIYENDYFFSFVPYAADVPFEVWVIPKAHQANFGDISDNEKEDLADALNHVLTMLHDKLNDPDYNYVINTASRHKSGAPHLHWYVQILPRLTTRAGFEIGSGISINPSLPESDAEFLLAQ